MNSHETNERNLKKLAKIKPLYSDISLEEKKDDAKKEENKPVLTPDDEPLAFARRLCGWITLGFWVTGVIGLLAGTGTDVAFPFMLFPLAVLAYLNIPVFWSKRKMFDCVVAFLAGSLCLFLSVSMLFFAGAR